MEEIRYCQVEDINKNFNGKKIIGINGLIVDSEKIEIFFVDNENIIMTHEQDCCECVDVEDISGNIDLNGAIFYEIIEKQSDKEAKDYYDESFTWTFYTIKTSKGYTDIRWYGTSNGYYSESVDIHMNLKG